MERMGKSKSNDGLSLQVQVNADIAFMEKVIQRFLEAKHNEDKEETESDNEGSKKKNGDDVSVGQVEFEKKVEESVGMFDNVLAERLKKNDCFRRVNVSKGASKENKEEREITVENGFRAWLIMLYSAFSSIDWILPEKVTHHIKMQIFWFTIRAQDDPKWGVAVEIFFAVIVSADESVR
jgi:hypothetical protein